MRHKPKTINAGNDWWSKQGDGAATAGGTTVGAETAGGATVGAETAGAATAGNDWWSNAKQGESGNDWWSKQA